ncbi:MAG: hypothetical protein F4047_04885 [Caldilineaceae bacterium SB0670_bin_27]|nr:hypothetical protein [Caldilineaceae bacterium SB0670_bin_27]
MDRSIFHRRIPASHKLRMLAAASFAALALSACGGGGGGGETSTLGQSPSARGVTAAISFSTAPVVRVTKGGVFWVHRPDTVQGEPTGWKAVTYLEKPKTSAENELFRAVAYKAAEKDEDYLVYGYWNRLPLAALNDYEPFYYGKTPYTGNVVERTGEVTYSGGATGVYQFKPSTGSTTVDGRFSANVVITVAFGMNTEKAGLRFAMSGIETLTSAGAMGPGLDDVTSGTLRASASGRNFTGDGTNAGATWGGQFYGPTGADPTGIAGWFKTLRAGITGDPSNFALLHGTFGTRR